MDVEQDQPPEDEARTGDEPVGHEPAHAARQRAAAPEAAAEVRPAAGGETRGDEVKHVAESAAELGLGAVIAPFTGGETVSIVGSMASMIEAGVDRLTHPGERETRPEAGEDGEPGDPDGLHGEPDGEHGGPVDPASDDGRG
jgi:hypothetical protein